MNEMERRMIHKPLSGNGLNGWKKRVRFPKRVAAAMLAAATLFGSLAFCTPIPTVFAAVQPETEDQGVNVGARAVTRAVDEPVRMDAFYGFDNNAKAGRYLPLEITIGNHQETAISGTLQIKAKESDGTIYRYDYDMKVEPLMEVTTKYHIPLGANADQLFLTLADENGATILNKRLKLNVSRDIPELFVGLLSDEAWELYYLDGVGVDYSALRTRAFELDEEQMPEEERGLNMLDVLVVNDYKLRNLTEEQTATIMDWVHSGGVLILGTGERVDDTLGRFAPELLDDSYESAELRHIDLTEDFTLAEDGDGMMSIACVDIPLHGGNVLISSNGFPLLTATAKEQGLIAVAAFDLGDIARFCEEHPSYVDHLFQTLLGESRIQKLAQTGYSGNSGKFWSVQRLINTGDVDKLPKLSLYIGVIGCYLLLMGPGLYVFLKNRNLRLYYRKGIVMLSLVFTGIIYIMGMKTRFRSTFFTYATIRDVTEDYVTDTTYVNIRNPYNRPYSVELNSAYSVLPITKSTVNLNNTSSFAQEDPYQIAIARKEGGLTVYGQNISSFTPRYFQLERKSINEDHIGISGEIDYFEGKISGTITNQFDFPLENTVLLLYGNLVYLDRMEAGETKQLADHELLRFPLGDSDTVAEWISGQSAFGKADIADKKYLVAMERANVLKFYMENYMVGYTADARVIAFSTENEESQFLAQPSDETYGLTMLTEYLPVNASRDRSLYRSALMKTPTVISGSYAAETNSMDAKEPLVLEYQIGMDIEVESLRFESISEEFLNDKNREFGAFRGSIYFYNYTSGHYDLIQLNAEKMEVQEIRSYLSPLNTLTVRYVPDQGGGFRSIQLPMPMVAGREQ